MATPYPNDMFNGVRYFSSWRVNRHCQTYVKLVERHLAATTVNWFGKPRESGGFPTRAGWQVAVGGEMFDRSKAQRSEP